ncbi:HAD-superfamily hydrolase, subfamily IA, variant 3 [Paludibacter propionicigenes WB4]|uniref:HAD-superfamily hydrolase, subfamily IA, variant 3 n=1 Tax=Paludibacter propionicigenes (strain DSM 17365 / JCM 13257 / WB4) TaxID=694427 RepID=E4T6R5_PALPW|nr:HAD family phosphatase [Paludibacter propionicigenes]ADQ80409.1 HAD-superfamily hydrolase, subfamily IA, variant 3 [Paludibacter propionicigenes WB4]
MTFKGAIFDFNGTLFWDTPYHDRAFDIFLAKRGLHLTDEEKRVKIHGKGNPDIMRTIFGNQLTDQELEDLTQEKELIYRELCEDELKFADGAEDLFNFLASNNIPQTIATSAGIENVAFYFEHMGLNRWFSLDKVAYNDGTLRGKPEPDVFLAGAEKLGLKPSETVIFEDSVPGIIAAEKAGAGLIYIVNSYGENYSRFSYDIITHFDRVDRKLFER